MTKERITEMNKLVITMVATVAMVATAMATGAERATELLKGFEGFRPSVYKCAAGKDTIGYGFTSAAMVARKHITEAEAAAELERVCESIASKLHKEIGKDHPLTESQEAAVISFVYNVGWANFKNSTMCRLLKEGKRGAVVGAEFRKWVYITKGGKKVVCKGLANRREMEAETFLAD